MKPFRIIVAALLIGCAIPIAVMALAWAVAAVSGCPVQYKMPHVCTLASMDIGWVLDSLLQFGVWGAITFGAAVYIFAGWVFVELAAIVLKSLCQSR